MSGKASPLSIPTPGIFLGEFRIERFDITVTKDREKYQRLRTNANKRNSSITIENIHDVTETEEYTDSEGAKTKISKWYIVMSWWEKEKATETPPKSDDGFYVVKTSRSKS